MESQVFSVTMILYIVVVAVVMFFGGYVLGVDSSLDSPHSPASDSRPEGPRKDERTVDGRSEYRAKLATLVEQVVKRWGPDVIEFKKQDGRSEEGEEG